MSGALVAMFVGMRNLCAGLSQLMVVLAIAGCSETMPTPQHDAGKQDGGLPPLDEDDIPPATVADATWHSAYRHCTLGYDGECLAFESCVGAAENTATVCASACRTAADCVDLDDGPAPDFTAHVACQVLAGEGRCVLACDDSAQCPELMLCEAGACVWPQFTECMAADGQYARLLERLREGRTACVDDADCTVLRPSLACPEGAQIEGCGIVVARAQTLAIEGDLTTLDRFACALSPRDCSAAPSCVPVEPKCVASECTGVLADGGV